MSIRKDAGARTSLYKLKFIDIVITNEKLPSVKGKWKSPRQSSIPEYKNYERLHISYI
jgi:hypothetical protein